MQRAEKSGPGVGSRPVSAKPLEGKPVAISRKRVTAKANASGLAVLGKGVFFLNGCQWRRVFTTLNKQLFRGNGSLSANLQHVLH